MPAETRLERLTALFINAYTLIQKGVRSERMVEELLDALQLFKEERLEGFIVPITSLVQTEPMRRREAFKQRLVEEGHDALFEEFLEWLPSSYCRNRVKEAAKNFPQLLQRDSGMLGRFRWLGKETLRKIEETLGAYGLYLGMSEQRLKEIFGPLDEYRSHVT